MVDLRFFLSITIVIVVIIISISAEEDIGSHTMDVAEAHQENIAHWEDAVEKFDQSDLSELDTGNGGTDLKREKRAL
jgi:hypothetical protein